jgi:hypothetical protein
VEQLDALLREHKAAHDELQAEVDESRAAAARAALQGAEALQAEVEAARKGKEEAEIGGSTYLPTIQPHRG